MHHNFSINYYKTKIELWLIKMRKLNTKSLLKFQHGRVTLKCSLLTLGLHYKKRHIRT